MRVKTGVGPGSGSSGSRRSAGGRAASGSSGSGPSGHWIAGLLAGGLLAAGAAAQNPAQLWQWYGDSAGDWFGRSVSSAGDVDGDGFDDVVVGAYRDDNNGTDSGSARVFSGATGAILHTWNGDSAGDQFGWSVSGAGDVDGDGFDDVVVGAPHDDNNGTDSGSATVLTLGYIPAATFTTFGAGCPGPAGTPSLAAEPGSLPVLGQTLQLRLGQLPTAATLLIGILGLSDQLAFGLPLPHDLSAQGMPGCSLLVAADATYVLLGGGADVIWDLPIPVDPALGGLQLYMQAFVVDPPANSLGATVTNGGSGLVGS